MPQGPGGTRPDTPPPQPPPGQAHAAVEEDHPGCRPGNAPPRQAPRGRPPGSAETHRQPAHLLEGGGRFPPPYDPKPVRQRQAEKRWSIRSSKGRASGTWVVPSRSTARWKARSCAQAGCLARGCRRPGGRAAPECRTAQPPRGLLGQFHFQHRTRVVHRSTHRAAGGSAPVTAGTGRARTRPQLAPFAHDPSGAHVLRTPTFQPHDGRQMADSSRRAA